MVNLQPFDQSRSGTTQIYVIPDWNGTAFNADTTLDAMLLNPPTSLANAVTFNSAVNWANTVLSPNENSQYNLAAGVYTRGVTINQKATVVGASPVYNPTTHVIQNYNNPTLQTLFAAYIGFINDAGTGQVSMDSQVPVISSTATFLAVEDICVPHIDDVIASTSVYPDSLFSGGSATRAGASNVNDIFTNLFNGTAGVPVSSGLFYINQFITSQTIAALNNPVGTLQVRKILLGAQVPSGFGSGVSVNGIYKYGWFYSAGSLNMGGITLFGNAILRPSSGWTNITSDMWGHSGGLCSAGVDSKGTLGITYSFTTGAIPTPGINYNYPENNIQLMNNTRVFPVGTGTDAPGANDNTWDLSGPVLYWIQNNLVPNSSVTYPGYGLWNLFYASDRAGFKGRFGTGSGFGGSPGVVAGSLFNNLEQRSSLPQYFSPPTLFVYASTTATPPYVSPASPGGLTAPTIWNLLNLTVQGAQVGVNINNGNQFNTNMII